MDEKIEKIEDIEEHEDDFAGDHELDEVLDGEIED